MGKPFTFFKDISIPSTKIIKIGSGLPKLGYSKPKVVIF